MAYPSKSLLFALAAGALAASPAAATTMLAGHVRAEAGVNFLRANADHGFDSVADFHHTDDDWTGAPNVRPLTATAHGAVETGDDSGAANSTITAVWDSPDAGAVELSGRDFALHTPDPTIAEAVAGLASSSSDHPEWSYAFIAGANGAFGLDFDLTGLGDTSGLGLWSLKLVDNGAAEVFSLLNINAQSGFHETGDFTHALTAGHTYTVSLLSSEIRFQLGLPSPDVAASESGAFHWSITSDAVPEPSAWALSIVGFGLAGGTLRRRRAAPA